MLEEMKALVKKKDICVLATSSADRPHCSLMAYVTDEDCREIYMVTHRRSRKYENLMKNPSVSLLIDTREEHLGSRRPDAKALTVSGTFGEIDDENKKTRIRSRLLDRHPHVKEFLNHPDAEILCIRVESFLLLDGLTDAYYETVE
ncbi:MAG: pyridoxamine 5'-phosphate oxidase family protein [Desulfobacteraceae bacterium]|jgi:nitroimidazol reductase NimA-like FMN-containing flavoprotein (pyridoxamine 5'-phosphate oxidase superfamily)